MYEQENCLFSVVLPIGTNKMKEINTTNGISRKNLIVEIYNEIKNKITMQDLQGIIHRTILTKVQEICVA